MKAGSEKELIERLRKIDHRGYPAYKELTGKWQGKGYVLSIDHVQGDPFASPSELSVIIAGRDAGFPVVYLEKEHTRMALEDHLIRTFADKIAKVSGRAGSGKSGMILSSRPGQEILKRSACRIEKKTGEVIFRFYVGFPAAGRTILAGELEKILFSHLPDCIRGSLYYKAYKPETLRRVIELAEDQQFIRDELPKRKLVAFVADGSVLPRENGISQKPMKKAIPFVSPKEDRVTLTLPHHGEISGMGIREGVTLIIGGGYHGKSTLLAALERGVYNHIAGDGREFVICNQSAMKIKAEDGRSVQKDDIHCFIRDLPSGKDTTVFSTEDASGSTSQAAGVIEAIESGAEVLLMDEDTCATNFMVRDLLMQQIVAVSEEPIRPFLAQMQPLYHQEGISTILVAGSSGAFFSVADTVIQMDKYKPRDVTERVKILIETGLDSLSDRSSLQETMREKIIGDEIKRRNEKNVSSAEWICPDFTARKVKAGSVWKEFRGRIKYKNLGKEGFSIGHLSVDLRAVDQLVDREQSECLARILIYLSDEMNGQKSMVDLVEGLQKQIQEKGMEMLLKGSRVPGNLALPRIQEIFATINRCRMEIVNIV